MSYSEFHASKQQTVESHVPIISQWPDMQLLHRVREIRYISANGDSLASKSTPEKLKCRRRKTLEIICK